MKYISYRFTAILTLAGIIYNTWPLGYLVDRRLYSNGLASDLENPNLPFAWIFIVGDIITALILIGVGLYAYNFRPKLKLDHLWLAMVLGLMIFGFFTGFGAAAPDKCYHLGKVCIQAFHRRISIDALETSIAALGLMLAVFSSAILSLGLSIINALIAWVGLLGWLSLASIIFFQELAKVNAHYTQQIFLLLCGLVLISIGFNMDKAYRH